MEGGANEEEVMKRQWKGAYTPREEEKLIRKKFDDIARKVKAIRDEKSELARGRLYRQP